MRCDRSDETVSSPRDCLNEDGIVGVVADGSAQAFEDNVQAAIEINVGSVGPKLLAQFLAGDNSAGMLQQLNQNQEGLIRKLDADAVARQGVLRNVHLK
jgi:hypothetical protein